MKNKKGFTLIELLAIIVILAIIAIITVPIILNIIERAKMGAAKDSAYGYKDAVNKYYITKLSENFDYSIPDGNYTTPQLDAMGVLIEGNEPVGDSWVKIESNKVTQGCLQFDEYKVSIVNEVVLNAVKGECEGPDTNFIPAGDDDTHKGIVAFNPSDPDDDCTIKGAESNLNDVDGNQTPTGVTIGCLKFYIYDENDDGTVDMILDHNTRVGAIWNSTGNGSNGPSDILTALESDTADWEYEARLIGMDEIAHIVGADSDDTIKWAQSKTYANPISNINSNSSYFYLDGSGNSYSGWQSKVANAENKSSYAWLYDWTNGCVNYGCNFQDNNQYLENTSVSKTINGYWTADYVNGNSQSAWGLSYGGSLGNAACHMAIHGIRPVITVEKSVLGIDNL